MRHAHYFVRPLALPFYCIPRLTPDRATGHRLPHPFWYTAYVYVHQEYFN